MDEFFNFMNSFFEFTRQLEETFGIDLLLLIFIFIVAQTLKSVLLKNMKDKRLKFRLIILILFITGLSGSIFKIIIGKMPIEEWVSKNTLVYPILPLGIYTLITKAFPNSRLAKWLSTNGEDKKK